MRISTKDRVVQYDVLRVVTTLMVVISHTHYFQILSPYGGCDYSALVNPELISWKLVNVMTEFINIITMPTFMALSGALFFRSMARGRYTGLRSLAADKAKRLLIPFVAVGILYAFPLKLVTGYFSDSENVMVDLILGQLLIQGNTHLWFLPAMFVNFLICYVLQQHVKRAWPWVLAVLAVVSLAAWNLPVYLVAYPLRFTFWFYGGYLFEQGRNRLDRVARPGLSLLGAAAAGAIFLVARFMMPRVGLVSVLRSLCLRLLLPGVGAITLYVACCVLAGTRLVKEKAFQCVYRNSFGIYLYSDPLNYVILLLASVLADGWLLRDVWGALVLCVTRACVTLMGAVLVTELLRRCRAKYII